MSEQFLLEDNSGSYFLEDSSGGYRQDFPIIVSNESVGITETRLPEQQVFLLEDDTGNAILLESGTGFYKQEQPIYLSLNTIGLTEDVNHVRTLSKTFSDSVGITDVKNRLRSQVRNLDEIVGVTEVKSRLRALLRNFSDTVGLTVSENHNIGLARNINEIVGATESFNRLRNQIRNIPEIVGVIDTTTKIRGIWKNISDIVGLSSIANKAEPSLFEYTLEDGSGTLYLEDGTGNYVQEAPVKVFNETVGIVETKSRLGVLFRWISETVGLSEVNEAYNVIKKVVSSTLGLSETPLKEITTLNLLLEGLNAEHYQLEDGTGGYHLEVPVYVVNSTVGLTEQKNQINTIIRNIAEIIGLTVLPNYVTGAVKVVTQFVVSVESTINRLITDVNVYALEDGSGSYLNEDGLGFYQLNQVLLIRILNMVNGLTETPQKLYGGLKIITDQLNVVESFNRLRDMVRNFSQTVGVTEASNRLGVLKKNFSNTIGITETSLRVGSLIRWVSSNIGITGFSNRITGFSKVFNDIIQLSESKNFVTGIVKYISDTIGLVGTAFQIRLISFAFDTGDYVTLSLINLSNFITSTQQDVGDMTRFSAYNSGDMKVSDG